MADLLPTLAELPRQAFLTPTGELDSGTEKQIGVYAIFDQAQILQYVGYSRNIAVSLLQHLVRQPDCCHWFTVYTIDRPDRQLLSQIQAHWLADQAELPPGNDQQQSAWETALNVLDHVTSEEAAAIAHCDPAEKPKLLKILARRLEAEQLAKLKARGVTQPIRFDPKLKEQGRLDVK
ncbi:MAG: GIY-YIG nuclease family protein [Synechocystis sp.]|nr:GIY-YIG nuclease family protein [Synechocystis sp.]